MGKKRIAQLLEQLETNQQQELRNAAEIFTVAQVAVNQLQEVSDGAELPALAPSAAPTLLTKAELEQRYGSYNGCRQAATKLGIKFRHNPSWNQLIAGFSYFEVLQGVVQSYLQSYPHADLQGIAIALKLD